MNSKNVGAPTFPNWNAAPVHRVRICSGQSLGWSSLQWIFACEVCA